MTNQISPEEYERLIKEQCPFCKISSGGIPSNKVYEDSKVMAFLDINPASFGHTLVVPKKHYVVLPQMSDSDSTHLFKVVKNIAGVVFEITQRLSPDKPAGVNIIQNNGAAAGQQVPHVHVHIIPRIEGDGVIQPWPHQKFDEDKMNEMQAAIVASIKPVSTEHKGPVEIEPKRPEKRGKPIKRKERSP